MRHLRTGVLALALIPGLADAQEAPRPGLWELSSTATWVISTKTVEKKCLSAADIAKVLEGPSNRHYHCVYPTNSVGGGRISLAGACTTKRGQTAQITVEGSYTADAFQLTGKLRTVLARIAVEVAATSNGRLLSPTCQSAGAKPAGGG